ncbi:DNA mismatch repair protein Mlh3 isoform X2 [Echeneis naucrates]|uniref:MutL homolog 3 (E. coli) n=1 Tax=Echeneis naucrates TaxID=173247 RepID=A0A665WFN1_ECHNA|nr:DNA mismatch repair protein Mlh3 isoform X2 [Echeneis naucrates]
MIKCLPKEVQGKVRSGVAIPSLQQCVEELILNSIDAGASCVGVRTDTEALKVQVVDNGAGLSAADMDCVGNRYYTSKCNSLRDLDDLRWYGFRGEALASIASLAAVVEIASRTRSSVKTLVKVFKNGKGGDVFEAETARPSAGTTVVICNFFHNMPVRRRRMDAVLEGERIRQRVEAISLMHPSVSFTLKNDCTGAMTVQLPKAKNTHHRFVQIHGLGRAQRLGEMSHTHGQFEVTGYIGREGHYNTSLQFLYVNDRLLLKTPLHKLLNFLLRRLSSSNQKNDSPDGPSVLRSPKYKRNQELHGVYVINIKCSFSEYDICLEPAKTLIEFKDWDGILHCIKEAVQAFLQRENLVAEVFQEDLDFVSPEHFVSDNADKGGFNNGNGGQAICSASTLDCSIGMKLASESVHRKRRYECVSEDVVCQESGLMGCEKEEVEKIPANDLQPIQNDGCTYGECRDEPQCDLVHLESASDNKSVKIEEPMFSKALEGSQLLCTSSQPQLSKGREMQLNSSTSTSTMALPDNITHQSQPQLKSADQLLPDCQGAGPRQTLISNRKIGLSDPFIHQSLHTQELSQITRSVFQQQTLAQKGEVRSLASKCKISLDAIHDTSCQELCRDFDPIITSKIPKVVSCQGFSLHKESGSLDRFRRAFGKCDEKKFPSLGICLQDNARVSPACSDISNHQNLSVCQKEPQKNERQRILQSPATSSIFTKLKPISAQNKDKKSLASKLCSLKQHREEASNVLTHFSRATSGGNTCPSSEIDSHDTNNNESTCDSALKAQPISGTNKNPDLNEEEGNTRSSDWLHHYDPSMGKEVYVNRVTGLSKYGDPSTEETQVRCTSDVTNLAVHVISETDDGGENYNSLSSLYSKWNNPVFVHPPMVGVDITSGQADSLAVKIHNILFPYRFSKAMIHSMKVIHQVDKKFLACLINTGDEERTTHSDYEGNLLVLVDQHAAHERVRLENLVADSYEYHPDASGERRLCSSTILPPLEISVTEDELRLLRSCQSDLRNFGLEVKFSQAAEPRIYVGKVPLCFIEKESNERRRGRPSVIKPIVEEYLREQIELLRSTGRVRGTLPLTVQKVLASLACHGAIKFNNSLSRDECHSLVASLSSCQLPFQCAHGRPSIAPLVDILHLDKDQKEIQKPNLQKLRGMYKAWELYGKR